MPFVFPPAHIDDYILIDGGSTWNSNLITAVDRCLEIVDDPSKIIMDIISCENDKLGTEDDTSDNAVGNFIRSYSIRSYNGKVADLFEFQRAYP